MPSAALAVLPRPAPGVRIRRLTEHRHVVRPRHLTLVRGNGSPAATLPPPTTVEVRRLLTGVLEVLDGRRSPGQLAGVLPWRYQRALLTTALAAGRGPRHLRSVHLNRTARDVVDLCARVEHGGRSRALAGRLALRRGRWECTLLELV
jgi:hypothetical protein